MWCALFFLLYEIDHQMGFKKLAVAVPDLQTTHRLVISCCCFAEVTKKFITIYDARTQSFFCLLHLLLRSVAVAVAVGIFFNSLLQAEQSEEI